MSKLKHLGIIIDGNRRWAKCKGLPSLEGHRQGYKKLKQVGEWAFQTGIKYLSVYAFSAENWQRSQQEVSYLMKLMLMAAKSEIKNFHKRGFKLKIIGQLEKLPLLLQKSIKQAEELTQNNTKGTFVVCLSYGGRQEILAAVKKIITDHIRPDEINEKLFQSYLYAPDIPSPDLIIRTGKEKRLSNFLTWQSVYSEFYFSQTLWPDFSRQEFEQIMQDYQKRQRRFGK